MQDQKPKKGKWVKAGKGALVFFAIVFCILAIAYSRTDLGQASRNYEKNKADAKALGLFFTKDDVNAAYTIPDSQNGASHLTGLAGWDGVEFPSSMVDNSATEKEFLRKWTEKTPQYNALKRACAEKAIVGPGEGNSIQLELFESSLQNDVFAVWGQDIAKRISIATARNEPELAKDLLATMASLALHTSDCPDVSYIWRRCSMSSDIELELQHIIQTRGKDPKWLSTVEATLKLLDRPYDFRPMVKLEHYSAMGAVDVILGRETIPTEAVSSPRIRFNSYLFARDFDKVKYIPTFMTAGQSRIHEICVQAIRGMPADPYDFVGLKEVFKRFDAARSSHELSYRIAHTYLNHSNGIVDYAAGDVGGRNALFQAVEMLKTGADPSKGLPLKGRYAMDADGKPIRVKHTATGWIVYSVWWDGVDDGGRPFKGSKGDWVVRVPG